MKKKFELLLLAAAMVLMSGCGGYREMPWQSKIIPGLYEYVHSWTYPSPEGGYTITCYEEGTIEFDRLGYFDDRAIQYHTANTPEQTCWTYDYVCHGRWKVVDDKFLFSEQPYDFRMDLMGVNLDWNGNLDWAEDMGRRIVLYSTPKDSRWVSFDIVTLNNQQFTWSYTYLDGHTDYWEMHRVL